MAYIGKQPRKAALTASDIEDGIITAAKIEDGAVVAAEIASNAVTTAKINADAVTAAKIADDAISEEHLDVTAITGHTAETTVADGDLVVIHDASATALRKMTVANLTANAGVAGISSSADATAITIDSNEQVGIGTGSPAEKLHIETSSGDADVLLHAAEDNSGSDARLFLKTTNTSATPSLFFGDSANDGMGYVKYANNGNSMQFGTNAAHQWSLDSSGNWLPAATDHGIYLGVNSATASNLLNDYEFGTWTPAVTGSPSGSYTYQYGYYTKINKMVYITGFVQGNLSGGSGSAKISGLPFTPDSGNNVYYEPVTIGFTYGLGTTLYQGFFQADATEFFLLGEPSSGARTHVNTSAIVSSDFRISFSGFYNTAA